MAALAIIGFNKMPYIGNRIPAAIGIPIKLYINAWETPQMHGLWADSE